MRREGCALSLAACALALATLASPRAARAVYDVEEAVTDRAASVDARTQAILEDAVRAHQAATGVHLAVLLVGTTESRAIDDYAREVAQRWRATAGERSVLVLLALEEHRSWIDVGAALRDALPDDAASQVLDVARADLAGRRHDAAVARIIDALVARTGGRGTTIERVLAATASPRAPPRAPPGSSQWDVYTVVVTVLLVVIGVPIALALAWFVLLFLYHFVRGSAAGARSESYASPKRSGDMAAGSAAIGSLWSAARESSKHGAGDAGRSESGRASAGRYGGGGGAFGGGGASSSW